MLNYENTTQSAKVKAMCEKFHMEGGIYTFEGNPENPYNGKYIVAGIDISKDLDVPGVIDVQTRNSIFFFPKVFAFKLTNNNLEKAKSELLDYLEDAEFVKTIYKYHGKEIPEHIDAASLHYCKEYNKWAYNPDFQFNEEAFVVAKSALLDLMESGASLKDFKDYNYNDERTFGESLKAIFGNNPQKVELGTILNASSNISTIEIQEEDYRSFVQMMKLCPDVMFAVYKKKSADLGKVVAPKGVKNPFEGEKTKIAIRLIAVKSEDIPAIANAYSEFTYKEIGNDSDYAKEVLKQGPTRAIILSVEKTDEFIKYANRANLPFFIDYKSEYSLPDPGYHTVCIPMRYSDKADKLIDRIFENEARSRHCIESVQKNWLDDQINKAQNKNNRFHSSINEEERKKGNLSWTIE